MAWLEVFGQTDETRIKGSRTLGTCVELNRRDGDATYSRASTVVTATSRCLIDSVENRLYT